MTSWNRSPPGFPRALRNNFFARFDIAVRAYHKDPRAGRIPPPTQESLAKRALRSQRNDRSLGFPHAPPVILSGVARPSEAPTCSPSSFACFAILAREVFSSLIHPRGLIAGIAGEETPGQLSPLAFFPAFPALSVRNIFPSTCPKSVTPGDRWSREQFVRIRAEINVDHVPTQVAALSKTGGEAPAMVAAGGIETLHGRSQSFTLT